MSERLNEKPSDLRGQTRNKSKKLKTVTENRTFVRAYAKGTTAASKSLAVYVLKDKRLKEIRYGITVSKDRGGAVVRNRLRRIIRAAYRQLQPKLSGSCNVIIVARQGCVGKKSSDLKIELEQLFVKTGLLFDYNKNNNAGNDRQAVSESQNSKTTNQMTGKQTQNGSTKE